jgi:hypothetical protein
MSKHLLVGSAVVLVIGLGGGMIVLWDRLVLRCLRPNADEEERDHQEAIKAPAKPARRPSPRFAKPCSTKTFGLAVRPSLPLSTSG